MACQIFNASPYCPHPHRRHCGPRAAIPSIVHRLQGIADQVRNDGLGRVQRGHEQQRYGSYPHERLQYKKFICPVSEFRILNSEFRIPNSHYGFRMPRFTKKPTTVSAVRMMNASTNSPVASFTVPASVAANGAGISIRLSILKLSEKFFGP